MKAVTCTTQTVAGLSETENEKVSMAQAHDKLLEACSLLLDQLQVGVGGVAVENTHPAWESVANMSKFMTALSALQIYLLDQRRTLSVSNEALLNSHHDKMQLVMMELQRVVFSQGKRDGKNAVAKFVKD